MKKQEIIEITTPEFPKDDPSLKVNPDEVYFERSKQIKNYHSLGNHLDQDEKRTQISKDLSDFDKKMIDLLHQYHFLNLFSLAVTSSDNYQIDKLSIDKYVEQLVKQYESMKKANNSLKRKKIVTDEMVDEIFYQLSDLHVYYHDLIDDLDKYKKSYYPNLKMASYTFCNEKTYNELIEYYDYVVEEINKYHSLQDTYDYICYNTGELITKTISGLISFMKKGLTKNYVAKFSMEYFLENEIIMYYDYPKWINLFSKINYVIKKSDKAIFEDKNFISNYQELEKKYIIVLIYNESQTMRKS
ncbi:MAG: hypothetical protein PHO86_02745 [Bacilli bacterium]|nr:hypothetical protein [Bacilli bacterium]